MEFISSAEELYDDPDIIEYVKYKSAKERLNIGCRAAAGFFIACHVFAYLSGKEGMHDDNWETERKKCANMISKNLVGKEIYYGVKDELQPKDYSADSGVKSRPILTNNIFREAARRFPLQGYLIGGLPFGEVKPLEPFIKRKEVLAEFLCHLNEKNLFLRDIVLCSNPVVRFRYDNSLPPNTMKGFWEKGIFPASENVIGVLSDWNTEIGEGVIFTDKGMYVRSPKNDPKEFEVRYDSIKHLQYESRVLLVRIKGGKEYEVNTPIWSKRNIHDFLQFASGNSEFDEKNKEMLLQIRLHTANENTVGIVLAGKTNRKIRGITVSDKEKPYISNEIIEFYKNISDPEERKMIRIRAINGFYAVCHALAYLSGKELKFDDTWDRNMKICANAVACTLGFSEIYEEVGCNGLRMKDFLPDVSQTRPIITKAAFEEAWDRFPIETVVRLNW